METGEKETRSQSGSVNSEKRRHPRVDLDLTIEYYRTNSRFGHSGRLMNASEGGLLIYFPEQMEIGERLKLKLFRIVGSPVTPIGPLGEVVWVDPHLDETWLDYQSGVRFIDISPEDLKRLKHFFDSLSQRPWHLRSF
jgi:c-di-GMP-binding flagellar brake protein YcgR